MIAESLTLFCGLTLPSVSPLCVVTLASVVFASSFLQQEMYSKLATLLLICAAIFVEHRAEWVGMTQASPWGIKLQAEMLEQAWCILAAMVTLVHLCARPQMRVWSSATLLASIGLAFASDLFHAYVWLEVITFSFLGFASGRRALEKYWKIHILTAIVVLIGIVSVYQDTGTLTLPLQGARQSSLDILRCGWLVKAGAGLWMLSGYDEVEGEDVFFVGSLFSKVGLLGALKVGGVIGGNWLSAFCALSMLCGLAIALYFATDLDKRKFIGAHLLTHVGATLIVASVLSPYPELLAMYIVLHVLADAFLLKCICEGESSAMMWWAVLFAAGLPPSAEFFVKVRALQLCAAHDVPLTILLLGSGIMTVAYLARYVLLSHSTERRSDGTRVLMILNAVCTLFALFGLAY